MALSLLLLIIIGVFGSCSLLCSHLNLRKRFQGISSPRSYLIIGHLSIVKPDVQGFVDQIVGLAYLYPEHPRMITLWIGFMPIIMVYDPEELEPIFSNSDHLNKTDLYQALVPWLGHGLLTSSAEKWRLRRKLLTPTFHDEILKNFVDGFYDQAQVLVCKLKDMAVNHPENSIEISKHVTLCALDIIWKTFMGRSVNAQQNPDSEYLQAVKRINEIIQRRHTNPLFWMNCLFNLFGDGNEHDWALNVLHSFTKKVIEERRKVCKNGRTTKSKCVIKECLCLQPSVPMFGSILGTDQNVGGFTIPKGT